MDDKFQDDLSLDVERSTGTGTMMESKSKNSLDSISNPPTLSQQTIFSTFGDRACGEPMFSQRLVIDFTPDDIIDNEYSQKKCCEFWEFISNHPELNTMMVSPNSNLNESPLGKDLESEVVIVPENVERKVVPKEKTALSVLEFVEEKGMIDRAFEPLMPQSQCSIGSREYKEHIPTFKPECLKKDGVCVCPTLCCKIKRRKSVLPPPRRKSVMPPRAPPTDPETQAMCRHMVEWDVKHPKSMLPPGHPPALSYAIMQRKFPS